MRIECDVIIKELENDDGRLVEGIETTCPDCGHCEFSFGTSERSLRRCLALMRENCPQDSDNYYTGDDPN